MLLDELALYAARLDVAVANGGEQLAAFLFALHGYARDHSGLVVVTTLASAGDAFSRQTQQLSKLLGQVSGTEVSEDEAKAVAERAEHDARSVVARDATSVTPVQSAEISRVLAKRLFVEVDEDAARQTADAYGEMYERNSHAAQQSRGTGRPRKPASGRHPVSRIRLGPCSSTGRSQGLSSDLFGITEIDAFFATAFPGLTPPQSGPSSSAKWRRCSMVFVDHFRLSRFA